MKRFVTLLVLSLIFSACSGIPELKTLDPPTIQDNAQQAPIEVAVNINTLDEARSELAIQGHHGILNYDKIGLESAYIGDGQYKVFVVFTNPTEAIDLLKVFVGRVDTVVDETLQVSAIRSGELRKLDEDLGSGYFFADSLTVFVPNLKTASNFTVFLEQAKRQEETLNDLRIYGHNQFVSGYREGYQPFVPTELKGRIDKIQDQYDVNVYGIRVLWERDLELVERWIEQLERALLILGPEFISEIQDNTRGPSLGIRLEPSLGRWHTGLYDWNINTIRINLYPYLFHPFDNEYLSEGGYSDEEMLYTWIHEITHAWQEAQRTQDFDFVESLKQHIDTSRSPTTYGWSATSPNINYEEDIAESVALYVLLPKYMQTYFSGRYDWIKEKAFYGKEFRISFKVPNSLASRLSEG